MKRGREFKPFLTNQEAMLYTFGYGKPSWVTCDQHFSSDIFSQTKN